MTDDDLLALYERTVDELYRYASRLTGGDRPLTDELVQEAYLAVLRRIRDGQNEAVDVGWLIVHCRHRFLDQLKKEKRTRERELRAAERPSASGSDRPAIDALALVPSVYRTALVLRYVDDLPVSEVARAMSRSVHATESLLTRARAALRSVLVQGVS